MGFAGFEAYDLGSGAKHGCRVLGSESRSTYHHPSIRSLNSLREELLAALSRVAKNLIFSYLIKKPHKPKKAKDLKLQ